MSAIIPGSVVESQGVLYRTERKKAPMISGTRWTGRTMTAALGAMAALALGSVAQGALEKPGQFFVDPNLPGNSSWDGWLAMSQQGDGNGPWYSALSLSNPAVGMAGYPGMMSSASPWPQPIASVQGSTGHDAAIYKVGNGEAGPSNFVGGPVPFSSSLYFFSFIPDGDRLGGSVAVKDANPIGNVKNIVLQIEIGEQGGFDFFNDKLPVLNYNGGSQSIAPVNDEIIHQIDNGIKPSPDPSVEDQHIYINSYLLQWDLSSVGEEIEAFSIDFSAVVHAQVYAMRLDQSDTFSVIPEPASVGVFAGVTGLLMLRRRRKA